MKNQTNPVIYFEIPVTNMERAMKFYQSVFQFDFQLETIDNYEMALFPFYDNATGISGALAKGEVYIPTKNGIIMYFHTENIEQTMNLALSHGGQILYPITDNGIGVVAEFEDCEGNRIALFQAKEE